MLNVDIADFDLCVVVKHLKKCYYISITLEYYPWRVFIDYNGLSLLELHFFEGIWSGGLYIIYHKYLFKKLAMCQKILLRNLSSIIWIFVTSGPFACQLMPACPLIIHSHTQVFWVFSCNLHLKCLNWGWYLFRFT